MEIGTAMNINYSGSLLAWTLFYENVKLHVLLFLEMGNFYKMYVLNTYLYTVHLT